MRADIPVPQESIPLPQYQSHKMVNAFKIGHIDAGNLVYPEDARYPVFPAPQEMFFRYAPVPGDYVVVYADGYTSFSPRKAFEEGYDLVAGYPQQKPVEAAEFDAADVVYPHATGKVVLPDSAFAEMQVREIARVCYEVNRAYCASLRDFSPVAWEAAPEWQKRSIVAGVMLHINNPKVSPAAAHKAWMLEKVDAGWTVGPLKNPHLKEHPCLLPFDQLPREQQAKDYIFRAVVHALTGVTDTYT